MSRVKKIIGIFLILMLTGVSLVYATYKPTNLETKLPPKSVSYDIQTPDQATLIFENETYSYYFKDSRDVLTLVDKRNGYTWKTGLDIASGKEIKAALRKDDPLGFEPIEDKLNQTFTNIANALITIEYYDASLGIKRLASSGDEATSSLMSVEGEDNHFILEVAYEEIDLSLKIHIYLTDEGYNLKVFNEEITGEDKKVLAAITLSPFLGASGGQYAVYDKETGKHGDPIKKPEVPGYVMVPDGSGSLIRFTDYNVSLKSYTSKVYGDNPAKATYNIDQEVDSFVPFKNPLMPVYGIAHGNQQSAFLGYASQGDAHMEIVVVPEENTTLYTYAYPRFVYNDPYYQVFNKSGEGFFTLRDQADTFDIDFTYEFLAGSGATGYSADYVGMALTYRDHLLEMGTISEMAEVHGDIPMRLDFVMSDQKKSVLGYENTVTTSVEDVESILADIEGMNIKNLNVGLLGWQDGGITTSKPWAANFTNAIGRRHEFESLIKNNKEKGIDISMVTDYVNIHDGQMKLIGNAAKHLNSWYLEKHVWLDVPFTEFSYAKPQKSAEWLLEQVDELESLGIQSHTIAGLSQILMSEHSKDPLTEEASIALYQSTLGALPEDMKVNMVTPNQYLWPYAHRFLDIPVYPTQFLIETDTVPFIQMVLAGSMELYGPYSNFSFSDQEDILRMIDYNIYPSFVLTEGPAYLLSTTNALNYYSTEYSQYRPIIQSVYSEVNSALSQVQGARWVNRTILSSGVVMNDYDNNNSILINYTQDPYDYNGMLIQPSTYVIVRKEG